MQMLTAYVRLIGMMILECDSSHCVRVEDPQQFILPTFHT